MTKTFWNCNEYDYGDDNIDDNDDDVNVDHDDNDDNDGKSRSDAVSNGLVFIASLADPPDIEQDIRSVQ